MLVLLKLMVGKSSVLKYLLRRCLFRNQLSVSMVLEATVPEMVDVSKALKSRLPVNLKPESVPSTSSSRKRKEILALVWSMVMGCATTIVVSRQPMYNRTILFIM